MNYVYCGSHLALLFALSLKNKGKKITIISSNEDIIRYCKDEKIDSIRLDFIRPSISKLNKIFKLKKMLNSALEQIKCGKDDCLFLTGAMKGYDSFYIAKELSKRRCKIYNTDPTGIEFKEFKPVFLRGIFIRLAFKLILNLDLQYYTVRGVPFLGVDDKFLKKYNIIDYPLDITHEELIIDVAKNIKSKRKTCKNLIIDQGSFGDILKPGSIKKMYENLLKIPAEYTFKKHPGPVEKDSLSDISVNQLFKNCEEAPRYIPAELLFNSINNSVISVFSAPLITASHFKHLKSISLIELVEFNDESYKRKVKNNLIEKSNNKILFPNSFEELKSILLNS